MYHEHDFWTHSTPLLEPDVIKDINKTPESAGFQYFHFQRGSNRRKGLQSPQEEFQINEPPSAGGNTGGFVN